MLTVYQFMLLLSLYRLCFVVCMYLYDSGNGLIKGTKGCMLQEKVVGKTAKYLLLLWFRTRTISTSNLRQKGPMVEWALKFLCTCDGKNNFTVAKAAE